MEGFAVQITIFVGLILVGLIAGKLIEITHIRRLDKIEEALAFIKVNNLRKIPGTIDVKQCHLVSGSAVIATDYFKVFTAGLKGLFGGELKTYQTLIDRARREAVVRMLDEARLLEADSVWNIRFETATMQGKKNNKPGGVEVLVYGTAVLV